MVKTRIATLAYDSAPYRNRPVNRPGGAGDEWIGIHCNGIHTCPLECIRNGLDWQPMQWFPLHAIGNQPSARRPPGKGAKGVRLVCTVIRVIPNPPEEYVGGGQMRDDGFNNR